MALARRKDRSATNIVGRGSRTVERCPCYFIMTPGTGWGRAWQPTAMAVTLFSVRLKFECIVPSCSKKLWEINPDNCLSWRVNQQNLVWMIKVSVLEKLPSGRNIWRRSRGSSLHFNQIFLAIFFYQVIHASGEIDRFFVDKDWTFERNLSV